MSANNALHIAVLGGDGIGPEVMAPALEVLRKIEATTDLKFRFTDAPAGANNYRETGKSMPDSTVRLCEEADAILLPRHHRDRAADRAALSFRSLCRRAAGAAYSRRA
jgi:3-isopropylmalate dehydrogenase